MTNRIINGVSKAQAAIDAKQLTPERIAEVSKSLNMSMTEYVMFQEKKSAAVGQSLTLDEAHTIYAYLGNTPEHFNEQSLAVKYTLTNVFASLVKFSMAGSHRLAA